MRLWLLVLLVGAFGAGCPSGPAPIDAATEPPDTSLAIADAGLDGPATAPDAGDHDAGVDGSSIDAPPIDANDGGDGELGPGDYVSALAVSRDGTTVLVGHALDGGGSAPAGRVDVWTHEGDTFVLTATLRAPAGETLPYFGGAVAIDDTGTRALVGATEPEVAGMAHVFARDASGWHHEAVLASPSPDLVRGPTLALSDDAALAFVGAPSTPSEAGDRSFAGAVRAYARDGTTWSLLSTLRRADSSAGDQFGLLLAATDDGSRIVAGSWRRVAAGWFETRAYVFVRSGSTWTEEAPLAVPEREAVESLAIDAAGTRVVLGLPGDYLLPIAVSSVLVVDRGIGGAGEITWTETARIGHPGGEMNARFGQRVALSADGARIVTGATYEGGGGLYGPGAVYALDRVEGAWTVAGSFAARDPERSFGNVLGIDGEGTLVLATCRPHGWDVIDSEVHVMRLGLHH